MSANYTITLFDFAEAFAEDYRDSKTHTAGRDNHGRGEPSLKTNDNAEMIGQWLLSMLVCAREGWADATLNYMRMIDTGISAEYQRHELGSIPATARLTTSHFYPVAPCSAETTTQRFSETSRHRRQVA